MNGVRGGKCDSAFSGTGRPSEGAPPGIMRSVTKAPGPLFS